MLWTCKDKKHGFFFTGSGWGSSPALNFGKKSHSLFAKGGEKLYVNSILGNMSWF
jgi:hypothetical protein